MLPTLSINYLIGRLPVVNDAHSAVSQWPLVPFSKIVSNYRSTAVDVSADSLSRVNYVPTSPTCPAASSDYSNNNLEYFKGNNNIPLTLHRR